jgi:hypothetical protein
VALSNRASGGNCRVAAASAGQPRPIAVTPRERKPAGPRGGPPGAAGPGVTGWCSSQRAAPAPSVSRWSTASPPASAPSATSRPGSELETTYYGPPNLSAVIIGPSRSPEAAPGLSEEALAN